MSQALRTSISGTRRRVAAHSIRSQASILPTTTRWSHASSLRNPPTNTAPPTGGPSATAKQDLHRDTPSIHQVVKAYPGLFLEDPEEYARVARVFSGFIKNGSVQFTNQLLQGKWCPGAKCRCIATEEWLSFVLENRITARLLHETACVMRGISPSLAFQMWTVAAKLNYRASIITLHYYMVLYPGNKVQSQIRVIGNKFLDILIQGRDPDALYVEGLRLSKENKLEEAAKILRRALDLSAARFGWKPECELLLAQTYLKLGERKEALAILESLEESGMIEATAELGIALRREDPAKSMERLYLAACGGRQELYNHLAQIELSQSDLTSDPGEAEDMTRWAMEWSRLADPKAAY
ncbi:hypothetical protein S40285_06603 [Stachybotrys chlorohalonatus IBT 40285]|uniref:MalT-like TPR region domain-containing protein n=1 Tax=Stachybotrys chlorohalonatus (strain IBT 40285) TaxID=1283841 RepID=A0A084QHH0_STAC4|nr:hypothetical protein S40285_06603 [Stachybotrys chlorohalonata IBT 40285]